MKLSIRFALPAALLCAAMPGYSATLDFNDIGSESETTVFGVFEKGGLFFDNSIAPPFRELAAFLAWQNDSSFDADGPGYSLGVNGALTTTTITRVGGGAFDLTSFDINDIFNNTLAGLPAFSVSFRFVDETGTTEETFLVDDTSGFQRVVLDRIGLTSFALSLADAPGREVQIDNLEYAFAGAVPEPASWALMIGGFGLVGGALRQRRTTVRFA